MKIIVSMGVLFPVNYMLSAGAFNEIFKKTQLSPLNPREWNEIMPGILKIDNLFMQGKIQPEIKDRSQSQKFRQKLTSLFSEKLGQPFQISDEDFDDAWNAMIQNLSPLKENLKNLLDNLPRECELHLVSGTNEIHFGYISKYMSEQTDLKFDDIPRYLSYEKELSKPDLVKGVLNELLEQNPEETVLIVIGKTDEDPFEDTRERAEKGIKQIQDKMKKLPNVSSIRIDPKGTQLVAEILAKVYELTQSRTMHCIL